MNYNKRLVSKLKNLLIAEYISEVGEGIPNANFIQYKVIKTLMIKLSRSHMSISLAIYMYLVIFVIILKPLRLIFGIKIWKSQFFESIPLLSTLHIGILKLTLFSYYSYLD